MGEKTVIVEQKHPFVDALRKLETDTCQEGFAIWGGTPKEEILRTLGMGPAAHAHHQPGTIFDLARLFLAGYHASVTGDERFLDEWTDDAVADVLKRRRRNHKRAQARALARKRQRGAGTLAALPATASQPENSGCAATVVAEGSQAENKFWDAVKEAGKSR
jgi:hypothetical protein